MPVYDLLNRKKYVSDKIHKKRMSICRKCRHLYKPTGNCMICLCFVKGKTKLKTEKCPKKLW